jgi:hypothetical protein
MENRNIYHSESVVGLCVYFQVFTHDLHHHDHGVTLIYGEISCRQAYIYIHGQDMYIQCIMNLKNN